MVYPVAAIRSRGALRHEGDQTSPFAGRWRGGTVVCLASGPSLTESDVATVRRWRQAEKGETRAVIAINTTFRLALWADLLFAMDFAWWNKNIEEVRRDFRGDRVSINGVPADYGVTWWPVKQVGNSGAGAIRLALAAGAAKIVLLGYDCQHTDGNRHWHGDHPKGLGNADVVHRWPDHFRRILPLPEGVEVLNASRATSLDVFPRVQLEDVLT